MQTNLGIALTFTSPRWKAIVQIGQHVCSKLLGTMIFSDLITTKPAINMQFQNILVPLKDALSTQERVHVSWLPPKPVVAPGSDIQVALMVNG
jgi:hypothetical protein